MAISKDEVIGSLRTFKSRRDSLLHEDVAAFDHHLERFLDYCKTDQLAQSVLSPLEAASVEDLDQWWSAATQDDAKLAFPSDPGQELGLRYRLLKESAGNTDRVFQLGIAHDQSKRDGWVEFFRTVIVRPFADELTHRIGTAADLATPEARAVQAVALNRIPGLREVKVFLSHKTVDKPLVYRYYDALRTLGFDPWLDEPNMPVGSNLEREVLRGFEKSCAAVFFITESFRDESYLAAEVDYAVMQKRKKGKKFAIITLRYNDAAEVPGLLTPYVFKNVGNDLEGFEALVRALPLELGSARWKAAVV